ncbi:MULTISPECIES: L,D-transpeptidase [Sporomusa]|uniref:L,D-transpeptidase n=1 Tax=Sporomusa TaxID=2375 RepID=UPI00166EB158|nr:L,D-transpeptidase [Sporomusa sp. GT1]
MLLRVTLWLYVFLLLTVSIGYAKPSAELVAPSLIVNLPSRTIELFSGDNLLKEFPVAIGKPATPTPLGNYSIICKEVNPAWYPPDQKGIVVPTGPANPLGYRWIGIWHTYGIHGTNAPWSIGTAVSNGCIRMYEEDVEELFDKVSYGTPVRITYDRIKVRTNTTGQILLSVYPDVYNYGSITVRDIRNKLNTYYLNDFVSDEFLRNILNKPSDKQVVIAKPFPIRVNGSLLTSRGLIVQEVPYIPLYSLAEALKQKIHWDEKTKTARNEAVSVPGIASGSMVFVSAASIAALFSGEQSWHSEENSWNFDKLKVFLNEQPVNMEVLRIQGILAVPALSLAEMMEHKFEWNEKEHKLTINDKGQSVNVPVEMVAAVPYIKITNINRYFDAYVYLNEAAKTLELTYP